jgi:hypothetical protein
LGNLCVLPEFIYEGYELENDLFVQDLFVMLAVKELIGLKELLKEVCDLNLKTLLVAVNHMLDEII